MNKSSEIETEAVDINDKEQQPVVDYFVNKEVLPHVNNDSDIKDTEVLPLVNNNSNVKEKEV